MQSKIAHIIKFSNTIRTHSLEAHANGVASLAAEFASAFGMGDWGKIMGILHDKGKERDSFQAYIKTLAGVENEWHGEDKQHAYIGAIACQELYKAAGILLGYPIMGHHSGLDDFPNYNTKLNAPMPKGVGKAEAMHLSAPIAIKDGKDMHHLVRMLFSCLVDADFLDTEHFMYAKNSRLRQEKASLADLAS